MNSDLLTLERKSLFYGNELDKYKLKDTIIKIHHYIQLENDVIKEKQIIIDDIYVKIKLTSNKDCKNKLINLKRKIYNNRNLKEEDKVSLTNSSTINDYISKCISLARLKSEIDTIFIDEMNIKKSLLLDFLESNNYLLSALSITNINMFHSIINKRNKYIKIHTNYSRSLFLYLQRASVKTSPLSLLTSVNLINNNNNNNNKFFSHISWNKKNVFFFFYDICEKFKLYPYLDYEIIPITTSKKAIISKAIDGNFSWKQYDIISNNNFLITFSKYQKSNYSYKEIKQILSNEDLENSFKYLLECGIIRIILPYSRNDNQPLNSIVHFLKEYLPSEIINSFSDLENLKFQLSNFHEYKNRYEILKNIHQKFDDLKERYNLNCVFTQPYFYEDSSNYSKVDKNIDVLNDNIDEIQQLIKQNIYINSIYFEIVDFINYKGKSMNLLEFLIEFVDREKEFPRLYNRCRMKDFNNPIKYNNTFYDTPVYFHLYWQKEGKNLIINKMVLGYTELLSRFNNLFEINNYKEILKDNNENMVEFTFSEEINNLQSNLNIFDVRLNTGIDHNHIDIGKYITLKDLIIYTDVSNTLKIKNSNNENINLSYVGSIPKHLHSNWTYLLLVISNPLFFHTDIGSNPQPYSVLEEGFYKRQSHNNIIIKRERRVYNLEDIRPLINKKFTDNMINIHKFFSIHDLSKQIYIYMLKNKMIMSEKPIYIDIDNAYLLDILIHKIKDSNFDGIIFEEACPQPTTDYTREFLSLIKLDV
ncbi:TPA: hypothetical protein ACYIZW_001983 [Staphylococcus pseudintermedius]|nr:hypothetical protein [Staphylococcus pseudintermedius]